MKKTIIFLVCLLLTPSLGICAKGVFEYDISYARIFPPTTSKQVIAGYLSCDNSFFGGVLKKVTYYVRKTGEFAAYEEFSYNNQTMLVGISTYAPNLLGTVSYEYSSAWPKKIARKAYGTGHTYDYIYNSKGGLIKLKQDGNILETYKETPEGLFEVDQPGGFVRITWNQAPANTWSTNMYAPNATPQVYKYTYNENNHITREELYFCAETATDLSQCTKRSSTTYSYKFGKLKLKRFYDAYGNFKGKSTFDYDSQNRLIKSSEFGGYIREYEYYPEAAPQTPPAPAGGFPAHPPE